MHFIWDENKRQSNLAKHGWILPMPIKYLMERLCYLKTTVFAMANNEWWRSAYLILPWSS